MTQERAPKAEGKPTFKVSDLTAQQVAQLTAQAPGWRPNKKGSILDGTVLAVKIGTSQFGQYPIVFVVMEDKVTAVHGFHRVLMNELMSQRPDKGDRIYIETLGEGEPINTGEDPPLLYAVNVTKPDGSTADPWAILDRRPPRSSR